MIPDLRRVGAAHTDLVSVAQRGDVAALTVAEEVFEGREGYQGGAMDAGEPYRIEPYFEGTNAQVAQVPTFWLLVCYWDGIW